MPLGGLDEAIGRYAGICHRVVAGLAAGPDLKGARVCELGAGNCLATTALFLGLGAQQVEVFEPSPPVVDDQQLEVLARLREQGLPLDIEATLQGTPPQLNERRVLWHRKLVENDAGSQRFDFIFSFSVFEHIEDLKGALEVCFKVMKPGARMVHVVDLGGHDFFEDPMPPLDFQVYPDWLFGLMNPQQGRATRRPVGEYAACARAAGFKKVKVDPIRVADPEYVEKIWPLLNKRIRRAGRNEVAVIEFILTAAKE